MTVLAERTMNSNIEIARRATLKPVSHYVHTLGLQDDEVEICNAYAAKIRLVALKRRAAQKDGKLILVSVVDGAPAAYLYYLYDLDLPAEEKIRLIAAEVYGADRIYVEKRAKANIEKFTALGYGKLPICMAKTQSSLSDRPRALGVPKHWTLTVTDARLAAGAGFLVIVCSDMMLMPGLPKIPAAAGIDVDDDGRISEV